MKLTPLLFVLFLFFGLQANAQIPTTGLVAYYPFSGNANDQSGNGNNGTVYGATLTTDRFGDSNSAYQFNGTSNYIQVANSSSLQSPSNALALSAWVRITSTSNLNWILDKRIQVASSPYSSYGLFSIQATATLNGGISTNTGYSASGPSIQLNTWMHISMTYDGSKIIYYANGVPTDTTSVSGNIQYSTMALYIGKSPNNAAYLQGKIDDIRIYNVALTPAQIQLLRWEGVTCNMQITQEPKDTTTVTGLPASFQVGTSGNGISYSWEYNDGNGFKPAAGSCLHTGAGSSTLNILGSLPWMDGYTYRCIVNNDTCKDTTKVVQLNVDTAYYQTYIDSILVIDTLDVFDTTFVTVYDTVQVMDTVIYTHYDTVGYIDTLVIDVYDTTYISDTTFITVYDTISITVYDSVAVTDTLVIQTPLSGSGPAYNTFKVYPNPASDHLYIDNGLYTAMTGYSILIQNALGQTVFSSGVNQAQFYIDLSTWTGNGVYFLYLKDGQGAIKETRKIILQ